MGLECSAITADVVNKTFYLLPMKLGLCRSISQYRITGINTLTCLTWRGISFRRTDRHSNVVMLMLNKLQDIT